MTKVKLTGALLLLGFVAALGLQVMSKQDDEERRIVLLTVVMKDVIKERGKVRTTISYKSSSTDWRQIEYKGLDPWNRTVSVKKGDTVYLEAWQQTANRLDCLISIPSIPGVNSNASRRSIGTVRCRLAIP